MFSGLPSAETVVVSTRAVKLIKSPVKNNGMPEDMTCWGALSWETASNYCVILENILFAFTAICDIPGPYWRLLLSGDQLCTGQHVPSGATQTQEAAASFTETQDFSLLPLF